MIINVKVKVLNMSAVVPVSGHSQVKSIIENPMKASDSKKRRPNLVGTHRVDLARESNLSFIEATRAKVGEVRIIENASALLQKSAKATVVDNPQIPKLPPAVFSFTPSPGPIRFPFVPSKAVEAAKPAAPSEPPAPAVPPATIVFSFKTSQRPIVFPFVCQKVVPAGAPGAPASAPAADIFSSRPFFGEYVLSPLTAPSKVAPASRPGVAPAPIVMRPRSEIRSVERVKIEEYLNKQNINDPLIRFEIQEIQNKDRAELCIAIIAKTAGSHPRLISKLAYEKEMNCRIYEGGEAYFCHSYQFSISHPDTTSCYPIAFKNRTNYIIEVGEDGVARVPSGHKAEAAK